LKNVRWNRNKEETIKQAYVVFPPRSAFVLVDEQFTAADILLLLASSQILSTRQGLIPSLDRPMEPTRCRSDSSSKLRPMLSTLPCSAIDSQDDEIVDRDRE